MENLRIVLLHGAGLGSWIWKDVLPKLSLPATAIDFPNRDRFEPDNKFGVDDYSKAIFDKLDMYRHDRLILVAHSIAGVVAYRLGRDLGDRLVAFAGIGAAIPEDGGSFLSCLPFPQRAMMWMAMSMAGTKPPESAIVKGCCNDLNRDQTDNVVARFVAESIGLYSDDCNHILSSTIPKFYVKLMKDKVIESETQDRMIRHLRPDKVAKLESGHLPMLSQPARLAQVLNEFFDYKGQVETQKSKQSALS